MSLYCPFCHYYCPDWKIYDNIEQCNNCSRYSLIPNPNIASWLVDNTKLSTEQISNFCDISITLVEDMKSNKDLFPIKKNPITNHIVTLEQIKKCEENSNLALEITDKKCIEKCKIKEEKNKEKEALKSLKKLLKLTKELEKRIEKDKLIEEKLKEQGKKLWYDVSNQTKISTSALSTIVSLIKKYDNRLVKNAFKSIYKYFDTLLIKEKQKTYYDDYDNYIDTGWENEKIYFLTAVIFKNSNTQDVTEYIDLFDNIYKLIKKHKTKNPLKLNTKPVVSGLEYENLCYEILKKAGYLVNKTSSTGDQGVDLIVSKYDKKCAIQCKYYSSPVGNGAVQEIIAGRDFYNCNYGIVCSNTTYTKAARLLASSQNIILTSEINIANIIDNLLNN